VITGRACGRICAPITTGLGACSADDRKPCVSRDPRDGHHVDQHRAVLAAVHALAALDPAFRGAFGHGPRLRAAHESLLRDGRRPCLLRTWALRKKDAVSSCETGSTCRPLHRGSGSGNLELCHAATPCATAAGISGRLSLISRYLPLTTPRSLPALVHLLLVPDVAVGRDEGVTSGRVRSVRSPPLRNGSQPCTALVLLTMQDIILDTANSFFSVQASPGRRYSDQIHCCAPCRILST